MKMWQLVWYIVMGMSLFITALVLAFTGHMMGAIFTAIIWVGWSNNANATVTYHQSAGSLPHQTMSSRNGLNQFLDTNSIKRGRK